MADATTYAFAGLLLLALIVLLVSARKVLASPLRGARKATEPGPDSRLIARKVRDETGMLRGETVRVQGEDVVLHAATGFLVVPKASLREHGEELRAEGVDWTDAERRGIQWRDEHEDTMHVDDKGMPIVEKR